MIPPHLSSSSAPVSLSSLASAMSAERVPIPPSEDQPLEFRKKDGSISKMRNHRGNIPILPQTKLCPHCPAKFTRTTHLNRHLRTHTNERLHRCDTCDSQFTRSDLLTRHKKSCNDPSSRTRRKSCASCMESKIKCDRQYPCSKCSARGKDCVFNGPGKRMSVSTRPLPPPPPSSSSYTDSSSSEATTPSSLFVPTPEASHTYSNGPFQTDDADEIISSSISMPSLSENKCFPSQLFNTSSSMADLYSSSNSETDTTQDSEDRLVPTNSQQASFYVNDVFEPFFNNLFSHSSPTLPTKDDYTLGWAENLEMPTPSQDEFPFTRAFSSDTFPSFYDNIQGLESLPENLRFSPPLSLRPALNDARQLSAIAGASEAIVPYHVPELDHYLYLFFSAFLSQIPIVHATTFRAESKLPVLESAMQACGALFVKTRKATSFISQTLVNIREALVQEFAKNPTDSSDQVHLILAVVLLQTIGLFHQQPDQRASSSIYHGMLVMMIRRTGMITKNATWVPGKLTEQPLESLWQQWIVNETTKRAIWWSYLHDCCHSIYFALPSSYHPSEVELNLPCEDALWRAGTSTEWFMVLQSTSPYGDPKLRLTGPNMQRCLETMSETRLMSAHIPLNPFSHFILIHAMLRHLFITCVEGRLPKSNGVSDGADPDTVNQEIFGLQYALHNWLQNWLNSPDLPKVDDDNEEPPFIHNSLPFYWLGQVSLLAYQEALPPFEQSSPNNLKVEVRFRLVKQWLRHIRGFLKKGDQQPTLFWDELMKMRLQTWQQEVEGDGSDDQEGLLGFFPEH